MHSVRRCLFFSFFSFSYSHRHFEQDVIFKDCFCIAFRPYFGWRLITRKCVAVVHCPESLQISCNFRLNEEMQTIWQLCYLFCWHFVLFFTSFSFGWLLRCLCSHSLRFTRTSSMRFVFIFFSYFRLFSSLCVCVLRCVFQTFCRPFYFARFSLALILDASFFYAIHRAIFYLEFSFICKWRHRINDKHNIKHKMHMKWDRFRCEKRLQTGMTMMILAATSTSSNRLWCW